MQQISERKNLELTQEAEIGEVIHRLPLSMAFPFDFDFICSQSTVERHHRGNLFSNLIGDFQRRLHEIHVANISEAWNSAFGIFHYCYDCLQIVD